MRRMRRVILLFCLLLLLSTVFPKTSADVGNFAGDSDWDSDWDSDSGSDWSYDWDNNDDDGGGYIFWGGSDSDGGGSGERNTTEPEVVILPPEGSENWTNEEWFAFYRDEKLAWIEESDENSALAGFFVLASIVELIIIIRKNRTKRQSAACPTGISETKNDTKPKSKAVTVPKIKSSASALEELQKNDPTFQQEPLLERVRKMYIQMQKAWMAKDWEPMRTYLTDDFYNQLAGQLQGYIDRKQTNHVERIAVLNAAIIGYRATETLDYLTVRLSTRICDYVTDDRTGKIVRGKADKELFMTYDWTLVRSNGVQTPEKDATIHCANCGAPLDAGASMRCPYCGTITYGTRYDWTLNAIRGVSQRS